MADDTNQGIPEAGTTLSGEASRAAAVKRLQKMANAGMINKGPRPGGQPRTTALGGIPSRGAAVNTGSSGLPKAGFGLHQAPGLPEYSPHPPKRRI